MKKPVTPQVPSSTRDKIAMLARLLTTSELQPMAIKKTAEVLPAHLQALLDKPEQGVPDYPMASDGNNLRTPV